MLDWTKPIQTKCGKAAKVICKGSHPQYPWNVEIDNKDYAISFTNDGYQFEGCPTAGFRLINTPAQSMPELKLDWTAPLRRIGDKAPVRVLASGLVGKFPYAVAVPLNGGEKAFGYTETGWWQENGSNPKYNLENYTPAAYINIYTPTADLCSVSIHQTREDADQSVKLGQNQSRIARIRLEDYEGRFDE